MNKNIVTDLLGAKVSISNQDEGVVRCIYTRAAGNFESLVILIELENGTLRGLDPLENTVKVWEN